MKLHGGVLTPFTDMDTDKMSKFKTNCVYSVDIKTSQNPAFRGKVFAFFDFCFKYWCNKNNYLTAQADRTYFRKELIKLAGYYDEYYNISGLVMIQAKSLSFENMSPEEFEECYSACIQAALDTIFQGCDESIYDKLISFF